MKRWYKTKIFFYLTIPIFLLFFFIVALIIDMGHMNSMQYINAALIAFIVIAFLQIYIFSEKILPEIEGVGKIKTLLEQQDMSGKLLIRRDLELTRANEKLRELDDRKSEFVAVVAHQLRTPLSGIKWTLDMVLQGEFGDLNNDQKAFLMKTYESNERMVRLVEDMLGADRVDSGKLHYSYVATQILDLFDNVLFEMYPLASKKHIKLEFINRNENIPKVDIDQAKMRAVIQNLLDNAIKYSKENSVVQIGIVEKGDRVEVMIKDQGIGIPEDQKKNIFTRFFRASNAFKLETDGTGLGLFIVKGIIEKHGGTIRFESEEGKGTAFYFTIKINNQ